jgi:predicted amidohydrolase
VKVAAIQLCPEFKKPKENLQRAGRMIVEAARNGAQLIVLPELLTTGYSFMSAEEAEPFAENLAILGVGAQETEPMMLAQQGQSMGFMYMLALKLGVKLVWGLVEKDPGSGKLYNSQVYMEVDESRGTGLGGMYFESVRKINLWGNDFIWASEGQSNPPVVRTKIGGEDWKVGLLICRDVRDKKNSEWKSFYEPGDADVVAFSANWGDGGFPSTSWMDFVKDNKTTLIVSNRYGKETCNNFGEGGICVIETNGKVHCKGILWSKDCIVYADITKGKKE